MPKQRSHTSPTSSLTNSGSVARRVAVKLPPAVAARTKAGGRPPKFDEPSRPVTMTLPTSTLRQLESIDPDRARAIVKLADAATCKGHKASPMVEIVEMVAGKGLLVVGPSPMLRRIPFLHMVEVAPGRYLLALDSGYDFKSLELAIRDMLDVLPAGDSGEHVLITTLLTNIGKLRKSGRVKMAEILFVKLDRKPKD